jgi:hypothetical protein
MIRTSTTNDATPAAGPQDADAAMLESKVRQEPPARALTPAARRALEEAAGRRAAQAAKEAELAAGREVNGRGGRDPVRYNDWEVKGITSDF